MKDYYLILDNLIKENDNGQDKIKDKDSENKIVNLKLNINEIQKEDIINEKVPLSNRVKTNNDILKNNNIINNVNLTEQNDMNLNNTDNIYLKKYIRRNNLKKNHPQGLPLRISQTWKI